MQLKDIKQTYSKRQIVTMNTNINYVTIQNLFFLI